MVGDCDVKVSRPYRHWAVAITKPVYDDICVYTREVIGMQIQAYKVPRRQQAGGQLYPCRLVYYQGSMLLKMGIPKL